MAQGEQLDKYSTMLLMIVGLVLMLGSRTGHLALVGRAIGALWTPRDNLVASANLSWVSSSIGRSSLSSVPSTAYPFPSSNRACLPILKGLKICGVRERESLCVCEKRTKEDAGKRWIWMHSLSLICGKISI